MVDICKRYSERAKFHEKMERKVKDVVDKKYHNKLKNLYLGLIEKENNKDGVK